MSLRLLISIFTLLTALTPVYAPGQVAPLPISALRRGFEDPPPEARLRCYWWWLNGNTTDETITHDLTDMSQKGFGGVLLVDANGSNQNGNANAPAGPLFGSPEWTRLYVHALKVASQLHLEVTLNITSGWNLGGPEVMPAQASKLLTWSRMVTDRHGFNGVLATPPVTNGFFRQIAVLAYPLAHGGDLPGKGGDTRAPLRALKQKSAAVETGISMPESDALLEDVPAASGDQDTELQSVIDVTAQVDANGSLQWQPPEAGQWEILRIGYTDSDARVSTSSGAWQGLAIDYMDRGAFDTYWDKTVVPLLDAAKPYLGTTLVGLASDSWELGGTNWTDRFAAEFRHRRGYDPVPYLPVLAGRIVGDRATSDRFLNDLRRTVADLLTDHYDHFAERAKTYGLGIQCESGGPHGAPLDALETFRSSAMPQTEYWAESNQHRSSDEDRFFTKEAASAADIYGKKFAAEEGMTSIGPQWSESLATDLKPSFDQALTEGMNRLVWHEFTSSPETTSLPGYEYFAGTHLNPKITWWNQGSAFFAYLNRSQFLLQQGHAVDDVLYFYGDQVPNFVRLKHDDPAHVLPGYDYDVTNEDALLRTLTVHDGTITTPDGNRYRLFALPLGKRLSVQALDRIESYIRQGGTIAGPTPLAPTGIVGTRDAQHFSDVVQAVWGDCSGPSHSYGKGTVFCGFNGRDALKALNTVPDFESTSANLDYVHRADDATDIYFVRNTGGRPVDTTAQFRVTGRIPEIWNAIDGSIQPQSVYRFVGGRTAMPLHLEPYGSAFVVFSRPSGLHVEQALQGGKAAEFAQVEGDPQNGFAIRNVIAGMYHLRLSDGREINVIAAAPQRHEIAADRWTLMFQPDRGAPAGALPLTQFQSWTEMQPEGARFFSGTATYRTVIDATGEVGERVFLTLTDLHEVCTVRINGKSIGTIWAMPYRLDVTDSLRDGQNTVELDVTNLWPNRIIGDAQPSATRTYTHTNIRTYTATSTLLPSGLIGPVALERVTENKFSLTKPVVK